MASKGLLIGGGIAAALVVILGVSYNNMTRDRLAASRQFGVFQSAMQGRADLLVNAANVAKGYATNEKETFTQVAEARAGTASINKVDVTKIADNPDLQKRIIDAQAQMNASFSKLQAAQEAYPALKADKNFTRLMGQLEGENNRVRTERNRLQDYILTYNTRVETLPGTLIAPVLGFKSMEFFKADEAGSKNPNLTF